MASSERRTEFQEILLNGFQGVGAEILGWVILPNHYHVLVSAESLELISNVIQHVHGVTSREWNLNDNLTGTRKVWYRFVDRMMRNEFHLNQSLNYIHRNPLKHKLVEDVYEWPWSSLFMYFKENSREWLRQRWTEFPPPGEFGKGWDDKD